ncbi:MAG: aminodeoxychorismate synthase component I [Bacteroidetes bacterium]|nr:aminodeoxychorismate synthase component I [Bacteroidota bacterium]
MSNTETTIRKMNDMGKRRIPFLFIIDFEMIESYIFPLDQAEGNDILFYINGLTNYSHPERPDKVIHFEKHPVSFKDYSYRFDMVMKNIAAGNTYLINLTCPTPVDTNMILKEIFVLSSAKYKLLFQDKFIVFSPETFVQMNNGHISSYPMKGTIDASLANATQIILNDKKETAEHYTIVDLIRNDLNMVAKRVVVEKFRYIDKVYTKDKNLLQVSSKITGELSAGYQGHIGEVLFTLLPAGSVTGAPKKKTVDIILEVEGYKRGFYTGIFGFFDGENLDSGVMIRFIEKTGHGLIYKSGGGITSFSDVHSEYQEMIDKVYVSII